MSESEEFAFFAGMAANNEELKIVNPDHSERVREFYRRQGELRASTRIVEFLREKGSLRDSFFGSSNWVVLQTENGALDIDLDALIKGENK
jgi:hypothetical protein